MRALPMNDRSHASDQKTKSKGKAKEKGKCKGIAPHILNDSGACCGLRLRGLAWI
jgi:hypothetical protein